MRSEFTVYRTKEGGFYLVSAGALERHDHDTLNKLLPTDGSVRMFPVTTSWGVLVLAGPRSRDVLSKVTDADLSNDGVSRGSPARRSMSARRRRMRFA